MSTNSQIKDITLPPYFPAVTESCKENAAKFFICIEDKMTYINESDTQGAKRGLTLCEQQLKDYTDCMEKALKKGEGFGFL
ncbi:hypothetical protein DICPUDRAFT_27770 [Dictyostelium purpureum]|uniref:Uncharacterized protein n=1 Tax=Dictyostelium purpureum TaxID=5786 RepID=F0ZAQ9_DICPU|nr:uncharacterized protein DICPUDRAFT_27770 [Dictyostelium purpureum]EGC38964.1 hypothetical protein DICPUDRAFT_27770 [Dictyostelium purpureum]|eukprot:XP_003284529.1 hypothetical protein DICPUDRAFT_27770 [Dictyostelium purpureum]